ncbi:hypothetical protein KCU83_g19, partial [Aureobasidium melanogenum]
MHSCACCLWRLAHINQGYASFLTYPSSDANLIAPQTCRSLDPSTERTSQNRKLRRHLPRHHHSCYIAIRNSARLQHHSQLQITRVVTTHSK